MTDPSEEYLTVESAGNAAGISPRTLRYWIKGGKLPAVAGPKGKLVRLADVLAIAEITGKRPAGGRQPDGNPATAARSAVGIAGNVAEEGDEEEATSAVSTVARAQLEAIRDEWLRPLVDQIRELERENGRLQAERDALADRLAAVQTATGPHSDPPAGAGATDGPTMTQAKAWWQFWRR